MIKDFIKKWEEGYKVVVGIKNKSRENRLMFLVRKIYYNLIKKFAEIEQIKNFDGFGLYDRVFIDALRKFDDPYPYFRGMISEIGFSGPKLNIPKPRAKRVKPKIIFIFYMIWPCSALLIIQKYPCGWLVLSVSACQSSVFNRRGLFGFKVIILE